MNTKEIVKTIENLTGLCFEISINDNQTEVTSTFNPEKINYDYPRKYFSSNNLYIAPTGIPVLPINTCSFSILSSFRT